MSVTNINVYTKEVITQIANTLLIDYDVFQVYTKIVDLANLLGIKVVPATFKDDNIAGLLKLENGNINIYVNEYQSITRQRFTIAHEIGHYILHREFVEAQGTTIFYRKDFDNFSDTMEQQANLFAASILMPERVMRNLWEISKSVDDISNILKVSRQAVYIRLISLGVVDV